VVNVNIFPKEFQDFSRSHLYEDMSCLDVPELRK
jgi:hypothetical protein